MGLAGFPPVLAWDLTDQPPALTPGCDLRVLVGLLIAEDSGMGRDLADVFGANRGSRPSVDGLESVDGLAAMHSPFSDHARFTVILPAPQIDLFMK